jgi:GT2 family glycosyltransferase
MGALLRQTHPLDEIIVVDNASTDETCELLAEQYPQVTLLRMSENLGLGAGFAAGLAYGALEKRHDWVWTFDQDSVPNDDALEILLDGVASLENLSGELGMVAPLPVHRETGTFYLPLLWRDGFVRPTADLLNQRIWFADLVISSGCMVRSDVVEKIGFPRADFFLDFIDFDYCLRARRNGYKIAIVTACRLNHEIGSCRELRFLGWSHFWSEHPPWREYYKSRNITFAAWWLHPSSRTKRFVIRHLVRHAGAVLLFSSNRFACLRKMAEGFCDGRNATLGARFRPVEQMTKATSSVRACR